MARPQTPVFRTEVCVTIVELEAEVVPVPAFEAEREFCPHAGTKTHMIMPSVTTRRVLPSRGRVMSCWTPTDSERFPRGAGCANLMAIGGDRFPSGALGGYSLWSAREVEREKFWGPTVVAVVTAG